jgi:putative OPT family oligopeptide transporter
VVCCAAAIAGDTMQDLKTGQIVKNTPWKLQVIEIVGTISAAFVIAPVLMLLLKAYGFKGHSSAVNELKALAAPQANLMAAVSKNVFEGQLPWLFVIIGAVVAIAVIILDEYLIRKGSSFRTPVLAVAIGIYLSLEHEVPILAGGIISYLVAKYHKKRSIPAEKVEAGNTRGILLASGFITGESLMGILLAIPIAISQNPDVLKITPERIAKLPLPHQITGFLSDIITSSWFNISTGIILMAFVLIWLYNTAKAREK